MGHLVGDVAIRQTADVLSKVARESDILCRWGGEEFTVLAENCTIGDVHRLSDAIHQAMLDETFFPANPDHKVTLSIGMTEALENDDAKSLLGRADQALFSAKNNGRNRTEIL
jgi:diguanylate cyclase (GGDEF)-like protein